MSIRVAGYEVLLEPTGLPLKDSPKRYYGGRIGTLEIGFNGLRSSGSAYSIYPSAERGFMDLNMSKSLSFTWNILTFSSSLTRDNSLGVTMGVGLASNDYTFEETAAFTKIGRAIHPVPTDDLKKAKLHTFALHLPVALEVNPSRSFFFSVGGYVDLMLKSHLKWKFPKEKLHNPYTNFLQAGLTARIGFKNAYLFGNYALVEMFDGGQGPALSPYTFGIGFGF